MENANSPFKMSKYDPRNQNCGFWGKLNSNVNLSETLDSDHTNITVTDVLVLTLSLSWLVKSVLNTFFCKDLLSY